MSLRNRALRFSTATYILWSFVGLLVATLLIVAVTTTGGVSQAWKLATTHQPEDYTALYFEHPGQLPNFALAGKTQTVYFRIANNEAATRTYYYQVKQQIGGSLVAHSQSVTLTSGQDERLSFQFTIPKPETPALITITVLGTNEQLTLRSRS